MDRLRGKAQRYAGAELARVVRVGGSVVFAVPNPLDALLAGRRLVERLRLGRDDAHPPAPTDLPEDDEHGQTMIYSTSARAREAFRWEDVLVAYENEAYRLLGVTVAGTVATNVAMTFGQNRPPK